MDAPSAERRRTKLHRSGGSLAVVIPKSWLERLGIHDQVEMVQTDSGILITSPRDEPSIEDEPEFALFLDHLLKDALAHPEQLGDVGELLQENDGLFDAMKTD